MQQAHLAFSAMQFLPVPFLVLSSLKRIALANEAMGRLLGMVQGPAGETDMAALDLLRGQALSQLGLEVIQEDQLISFDWERYLDSLIPMPTTEEDTHKRKVVDRPGPSGENFVGGGELLERVNHRPGQTGVVEVQITKEDNSKPSSDTIPKAANQYRAKVAITPFQVNDKDTYFNLAFTEMRKRTSPMLQSTSDKTVAGSTGRVPVVTSASTNIDQRIRPMQQKDEEQFRTICDTTPQLVWTTTPDGTLDFCNQRWYEYTGLTPEASVGEGWMSAVHPEDIAESERLFQRSLNTGGLFQTECRYRSKEGEWNWFLVRALPFISKETGKIERWLGTCTYAHESIESRREVERTWRQLLTVISHAQVTVFQVDTQRRVTLLEGIMVEEALSGHNLSPRWYEGRDMYEVFGKVSKATDERQHRFLKPIETILAGYSAEILHDDEFGKLSDRDREDYSPSAARQLTTKQTDDSTGRASFLLARRVKTPWPGTRKSRVSSVS